MSTEVDVRERKRSREQRSGRGGKGGKRSGKRTRSSRECMRGRPASYRECQYKRHRVLEQESAVDLLRIHLRRERVSGTSVKGGGDRRTVFQRSCAFLTFARAVSRVKTRGALRSVMGIVQRERGHGGSSGAAYGAAEAFSGSEATDKRLMLVGVRGRNERAISAFEVGRAKVDKEPCAAFGRRHRRSLDL